MIEKQYLACPPPDRNTKTPQLKTPKGAWDTHAHIFGPPEKYPLSPKRGYNPPLCTLEDYFALHRVLGIERGVLIQASAYGTDNSMIMDALKESKGRLQGVAAVDKNVTDAELERLNEAGFRGIRINLADPGGNPFNSFVEVAEMGYRIKDMRWHMEFLLHVNEFPDVRKTFGALPVDSVFGHLGYMPTSEGVEHPGFQDFLGLVRDGRAWVKLTAPNRITGMEVAPYSDVDPYARALIKAAPDRMLWGSDWPHVFIKKPMPNDGDLIDQLLDWAPEEEARRKIFVDNPATLYGF